MSESFVDLTYRGLPLGRRVKLTQIRPSAGYLELPTPMPVGSTIAIATDEGVVLEARVLAIQEQVGAAPTASGPVAMPVAAAAARIPGMLVAPALAEPGAQAWWAARVSLPALEPAPPPTVRVRGPAATVRPRSQTIPEPPRDEQAIPELLADRPELLGDDGTRTTAMDAVDPDMLAGLADDGRSTVAMDAVDLSALGLETSGPMVRATGDGPEAAGEGGDSTDEGEEDVSGPVGADGKLSPGGSVKRRRKKR